ncbi:hypothetical protein FRC04_002535 [Tulasnella sp. 424]|nr:hypothetical protein FRC04_002535 [Tulasnella sp. 424]
MFHHVLVPTANTYVTELDAETRARKLAEEQLEKEIACHAKAGGLRVKERERRWDAEDAKAKARHEMETVMKENKEIEGQLFELQARTDYRHVEALQDALQGLKRVDTSDGLRVSLPVEKCIVAFIEQLHADTRSDSGRSWSSSWLEERTTARSVQEPSDVSEGEETCSEESGEHSRTSPCASASHRWPNEGLTWVNNGSGSPASRPLANPLRRMPRGRQGGRLNAMRVASAFGDCSDEDDFGEVLDHQTYRVPHPNNGDESD